MIHCPLVLDFICSPLANFYAIHILDHSLLDLGLPYLEKIVVSVSPLTCH